MSPRIKEIFPEDVPDIPEEELRVTFYPELYLERRIWILNVLRRYNITKIVDVGCGEGELLLALSQPTPWLPPPPESILPLKTPMTPIVSPTFHGVDDIPNLHPREVHGLDLSAQDLAFVVNRTKPSQPEAEDDMYSRLSTALTRFEDLDIKIWKGGLETINEEFVGIECIVSTEVIEHLPPSVFPFFAPVLLGVYHPTYFFMTTPSYTFNARFTSPYALPSTRRGFKDPTNRTDRVFRHSDHKFEWTREEFEQWCNETATAWGYGVRWTTIGRPIEADPYGRDEELQGASFVAEFYKLYDGVISDGEREKKGREVIKELAAPEANDISREPQELLAHHRHTAHPSSGKPRPLREIARVVKDKMESYREAFMRLEELWFEKDICVACGGWIEFLIRAVEESSELFLKKEEDGVKRKRDLWTVEIIGAVARSNNLWGDTDAEMDSEAGRNIDSIPPGWTPGEGSLENTDYSDLGESTGADGDISLCNSENEDEGVDVWSPEISPGKDWPRKPTKRHTWAASSSKNNEDEDEEDSDEGNWGSNWTSRTGWNDSSTDEKRYKRPTNPSGSAKKDKVDGNSSTAGWDGDADDSDMTS
ncbi:hypothetical protein FA15DRAFT_646656 [Coprinopsis marcescibilis]|uniref:Small RNA 2'-O-methyltransferase n=1 Tax=Coprinopsis marcescibilis TaxID=230819 RepID=A0A5C3KKN4_COPMA|nr:hypothetical protein FA15DRAFT_646656 [Coprinopsis marcescibilis]